MALRVTFQYLLDNGHLNVDQDHELRNVMTLEEMVHDYNCNQLNIAYKYLVESGQVQISEHLPQTQKLEDG